jgi:hypothetical protein
MIIIREYKKQDASKIGYLQPEGWNDLKFHFDFFERSDFCYPFVAVINNVIVGVANCLQNKGTGWISHIIVSENHRNQGLGHTLTSHVMNILAEKKCHTQLLIATKMGENLYLKLGFKKSCLYNFYNGKKLDSKHNSKISKITTEDFTEILKFDYQISGEYRKNMISKFISNGYVYRNNKKLLGYFLPELGDGVILASDQNAGVELLKLKNSLGTCKNVLPENNVIGNNFLKENGFELFNQAYRMVLGPDVNWKPQCVFCRIGGYYA